MKRIGIFVLMALATIGLSNVAEASAKQKKAEKVSIAGTISVVKCEHHMATQESHAGRAGNVCAHERPQLAITDSSSGKVYKLAPSTKQRSRVRLINLLLGHATMMIDMPLILVEEVTGISGPDFSGLSFSAAYDSASELCCKQATVEGVLAHDENGEYIEVRKIKVEETGAHNHMH